MSDMNKKSKKKITFTLQTGRMYADCEDLYTWLKEWGVDETIIGALKGKSGNAERTINKSLAASGSDLRARKALEDRIKALEKKYDNQPEQKRKRFLYLLSKAPKNRNF